MLNKEFADRFRVMMVCIIGIFVILIARMAYLQLYRGDFYYRQAEGNRTRFTTILAPRGIIYDCNGEELVNNKPGFVVSLTRNAGEKYSPELIAKLAVYLRMSEDDIQKIIDKNKDSYEPVRLMRDAPPDVVTKIEENMRDLHGVMLEVQPVRNYVNRELAVHALGYVGEVSDYDISQGRFQDLKAGSIVGKFGLENFYDQFLRGTDGSYREEVDVNGRIVQILSKVNPHPGQSLVLTIDAKMQRVAEEAVDKQLALLRANGVAPNARACAVVAIEPNTGEIKAMVSRPGFDPNLFVNGISSKNWRVINEDPFNPMTNKAIAGEYPPGSTFKIVTGAAALQTGKVTPNELIFDSGRHWLVDMRNAGGEALGYIDFQTALAASDNVYFYEMGNRLGIDLLDQYAAKFGFGKATGVDLYGESSGMVANPAYKKKVFNEDWFLGDTFNASIGQGFNLVTPLQDALMLCAIANEGKQFKPHLVKKVINDDGSVFKTFAPELINTIPVDKNNIELIQRGLRGVTQEGGTAASLATLPVIVAGKTGTAENPHGVDHGWFIAYAPADQKPSLVVVVVVEQGNYGALSAAPIVRRVLEYAFKEQE